MKAFLTLSLAALTGCSTIGNFVEGPHVYGGVRSAYLWGDLTYDVAYTFDLPFSFVLDTGLLPVTALTELLRWSTGWPPASDRLYPDPDWKLKRQIREAKRDLGELTTALELYRTHKGAYPSDGEGLKALYERSGSWDGRYLVGSGPRPDPWGNAYVYRAQAPGYRLFSRGPDGRPDSPDDVEDRP